MPRLRPSVAESRATRARWNDGRELTRVYLLYLSNPTNDDLREEFAKRSIDALRKKVAHYVYQGICPRFLAPSTFAEDAFSLALEKFWSGIPALREPKKLNTWLSRVAHSAVVEELLSTIRRTKDGPCTWEALERENAQGTVIYILDAERNRQAAERYGSLSSIYGLDVKHLIHQDILHKLLRDNGNGSKRQHEGSNWLMLILTLDLTVDEIAARRRKTKADVWHLLKTSKKNMRDIAENRYKFTAEDL